MRSHHGCVICRQRKLKCDEAKPTCGQCAKSSRNCVFSEASMFRNFELQSRLKRGHERDEEHDLSAGLFEENQIWLDVPPDRRSVLPCALLNQELLIASPVTFMPILNPFDVENTFSPEDEPSPHYERSQVEDVMSQTIEHALTIPLNEPEDESTDERQHGMEKIQQAVSSFEESNRNHPSPFTMTSHIEDGLTLSPSPGVHDSHSGTGISVSDEVDSLQVDDYDCDTDTKILTIQLLRHFREGPGQWMDLFDTSAYFSSRVLIQATTRSLLKSAVCALAAKHLSRIRDDKTLRLRQTDSFNDVQTSEVSAAETFDWEYYAVRFYHQAIRGLKHAIALGDSDESQAHGSDRHSETFAAIAILCMYELMDAPGNAWKAHLMALPLCSSLSDATFDERSPAPILHSAIQGPIFWSLARQDFLCAFISETQTRLNLDYVQLWRNFGLAKDENNLLLPFSPFCTAELHVSTDVVEDTKSNELLWLLGKIVNYITSGDGINPEDFSKPECERPFLGVTQEELLRRWMKLETELQCWYNALPSTFSPSARTRFVEDDNLSEGLAQSYMEKIWYDVPMCAATMQSYHMACILLLVNRPQESTAIRSTVSARLRSYRHIVNEISRHGREICGINLASPPDPVRIHSVQPLFVAGQSFHEPRDQQMVIRLLTGIEKELGWATNYQVRKLNDEWRV